MSVEVEAVEVDLQTQVDELQKKVESLLGEHHEFRKVHVSRKGPEGGRGADGKSIVGPQGPPADPREVATLAAEIVQKAYRFDRANEQFDRLLADFEAEIKAAKAAINFAVIEELKASGVIDAEGRAVPGPAGADSQVPGAEGKSGRDGVDGKSIVGPAGRDAKIMIGKVSSGETASATLREENGTYVLDLILPRGEKGNTGADSMVPGPVGERGETGYGIPGTPGISGLDRGAITNVVMDLKKRGVLS